MAPNRIKAELICSNCRQTYESRLPALTKKPLCIKCACRASECFYCGEVIEPPQVMKGAAVCSNCKEKYRGGKTMMQLQDEEQRAYEADCIKRGVTPYA